MYACQSSIFVELREYLSPSNEGTGGYSASAVFDLKDDSGSETGT